jgi:hypothetical protein
VNRSREARTEAERRTPCRLFVVEIAELLGISGPAVLLARRGGRGVLAAQRANVDEVLSWRAADA